MSLFSGNAAANAATDAARTQELAGLKGQREIRQGFDEAGNQLQGGVDQANQFLNPFQQVGNQALAQSNLLTDPNAQFDFIQNNPLFQASLQNANANTMGNAAASGRLTSGDTMQQLSNNTMLAAQPLLAQQQANIQQGLNFGSGIAGQQAGMQQGLGQDLANLNTTGSLSIADLLTSIGAAKAGGIIGAQNARTQAQSGALNAGLGLAGMMFPAAAPVAAAVKKTI